MNIKKKYAIAVYNLYIEGVDDETIGWYLKLSNDEVNDIIDYVNKIMV